MPEIRTVVLYGNSLAVSSIGASLQGRAGLQVLPLDAALPDAARQLSALQPDILIFDLATTLPNDAVRLYEARPTLLLIGVDLAMRSAVVLAGQPARALTTDDLVQVIESHGPVGETRGGGDTETRRRGDRETRRRGDTVNGPGGR